MAITAKPETFTSGTAIVASEHNSNFDAIFNDYNGNVTDANCAAAMSLALSKLDLSDDATFTGDLTLSGDTTVNKTTVSANYGTHYTEGTVPSTAASEGAVYVKDSGTQPELFYREESDGTEIQITSDGVVGGKTFTYAIGPCEVQNNDNDPNNNGKVSAYNSYAFALTNQNLSFPLRIPAVIGGNDVTISSVTVYYNTQASGDFIGNSAIISCDNAGSTDTVSNYTTDIGSGATGDGNQDVLVASFTASATKAYSIWFDTTGAAGDVRIYSIVVTGTV